MESQESHTHRNKTTTTTRIKEKCRRNRDKEIPRFRKGRGTRDQVANISWNIEKVREFQKNIYFCFIDYAKAFDCVNHNKLWKILQEMGIPPDLPLEKSVHRSRSNSRLVPNWKRSTSRMYSVTCLFNFCAE